jgi:hypothetical protein
MNNKRKESLIAGILFLVAGIIFIVSGSIGENKDITFISLGCSFIALSVVFSMQYKNNNKDENDKK